MNYYSREIRKEKRSLEFGNGTKNVYKSKWFAYETMMFLKNKYCRLREMPDIQVIKYSINQNYYLSLEGTTVK